MSDYLSTQTITREMHTQLKLEIRFYKLRTTDSNNQRLPNRGKQFQGSIQQLLAAVTQCSAGHPLFRRFQNTSGNSFWASRLYQQDLDRTATDMALGIAASTSHVTSQK